MTSNDGPTPLFTVGQVVKLRQGQTAYGGKYGNNAQTPLNMTHDSDAEITVESRKLESPQRTSITPTGAPGPAQYWTYRLRATLAETYVAYMPGKFIEPPKGRVKHTNVSISEGVAEIADTLLDVHTVVFLLQPFTYKEQGNNITLKAGTPVQIAQRGTTSSGGLSGTVSTDNAYYAIRLVREQPHKYTWRTQYAVHEAQLMAA